MQRPGVTLVVTSCQRFDLLERTLSSFFRHNDAPLVRVIVVEDSDDRSIEDVLARFPDQHVELILNGERLGQHRSIDRAYATVDTEYVFHCEDDWEFGRSGIVRESLVVLAAEPKVLLVLARSPLSRYMRSLRKRAVDGTAYRRLPPTFHHKWYSFSFNPGLRRMADYRALPGGYAAFSGEAEISRYYKRLGWSMAVLEDAQVEHIGYSRSTGKYVPRWKRPYNELVEKPIYGFRRRMAHYSRLVGLSKD